MGLFAWVFIIKVCADYVTAMLLAEYLSFELAMGCFLILFVSRCVALLV